MLQSVTCGYVLHTCYMLFYMLHTGYMHVTYMLLTCYMQNCLIVTACNLYSVHVTSSLCNT